MHDSMVDELIGTKKPFFFSDLRDELFLKAMQEAFLHHYKKCGVYQTLCHLEGFSPDIFRNFEDIFHIPHFFVNVLKTRTFSSVPDDEIRLTLKSSGTAGQRSQILLDEITLNRITKIVKNIYEDYGMADETINCNCILFSYEHKFASDVGTAFSDKLLSGLTGVKELAYALKWSEEKQDFVFDIDGVIEALIKFDKDDAPLRIIGFPAFLYELCREYGKRELPQLNFGEKSYIIIGGGWKTKADQEIARDEFNRMIAGWLGMPSENIRDLFGMVEHGVPYCECERGNLHVPIYSRAVVRDPENMAVLPHHTPGLLHFYTPYLHSFPAISLLTTDMGMTGGSCPCGRNAPYIKILGRAGLKKHKGCAISALDFLKQ